ncbi:addiction module antidote protein [Desulfonatronum thioautotrophicum]|uniref:addiction module antidote protein n=1 Tax=Desulfonatronum thioautotrophicum TaxID=617001 RepID=UPI0005EB71DC|nr:addiction module antidote protein [Desulfonatronum thioautotrophicum]
MEGTVKTKEWDVVEHLRTEEDIAAYFEAALETEDPVMVLAALGDIARARGLSGMADDVGLDTESLANGMSANPKPDFPAVFNLINALGLKLHVQAVRLLPT